MSASFIWYELMTTDPDAAKAFYDAVVGWSIDGGSTSSTPGLDYRMICRSGGGLTGGMLGLTAEMQAEGAHPCWIGYLCVADVDAALAAIVADGGKALMAPVDLPDTGRFAMVTDPQGAPFYIMAPTPPPERAGAVSDAYDRTTPQHVSWNELYTSDLEGAKAFYAKHFGFAFNTSMPMGEFGEYWFIDQGEQTIGAVMTKPPFVPAIGWNYYIRVDSMTRAVAAVAAGGGRIHNGPMEVPGGDWIANGIDPQGAPFALVGAKGE